MVYFVHVSDSKTTSSSVKVTPHILSLFRAPLFILEYLVIGVPFFFLHGFLVMAIVVIVFIFAPAVWFEGIPPDKVFGLEDFKTNYVFLIIPLFLSVVMAGIEFVLGRRIIVRWKFHFFILFVIDTLIYVAFFIALFSDGVFSSNNGRAGVVMVILLYLATITFAYLHFLFKDFIYRKINNITIHRIP